VRATHTVPFEVTRLIPAVAQGALAVETRKDATELSAQLRAAINDEETERAVLCERAALRTLQGGCQAPIGIHARFEDGELAVDAVIAALDGSVTLREQRRGTVQSAAQAEALGVALAQALLEAGAKPILAASPRPQQLPLAGKLILLGRTQERAGRIAAALRADGAEVIEMRAAEPVPDALAQRVPDLILFPSSASVNAAAAYLQRVHRFEQRPAIAAMGPATSAAAHALGFTPDLVAPEAAVDAVLGAVRAHLLSKEQRS
jgi:hypothetical protein